MCDVVYVAASWILNFCSSIPLPASTTAQVNGHRLALMTERLASVMQMPLGSALAMCPRSCAERCHQVEGRVESMVIDVDWSRSRCGVCRHRQK